MEHWEIILFFLAIAFVYASVGFGGGSSYLAILALYALPFQEIKLAALICNVIVVTGGTIVFIKNGQLNWRKVLPLVLVSVPCSYLGATIKLSQNVFFILLGCSLIVAAILLWIKTRQLTEQDLHTGNDSYVKASATGGAIGFLSGMVGIGGGIFLSPVLNLMKWDTPKRIAATASFFILVNSIAGIAGQLSAWPKDVNFTRIGLLSLAVFIGGQVGSRLGAIRFNQLVVRRVTAVVVLAAGIEVLVKHLSVLK
jgi:uncharacterized membrane protein YfcA